MTFGPPDTLGPFLPINQTFSKDSDQFLVQITQRYRDVGRYLNIREIAIYDLNQNPTGQQWFNPNNIQIKRDGFRRVYTFTAAGSIAHSLTNLTQVIAYGQYTDGTNFYGLIYGSNTTIAGQVSCYVTPTNIVIQSAAGAPTIISGIVVLEYLKN